MKTLARWIPAGGCVVTLLVTISNAQVRIAVQDWPTSRADAQRTSAIRFDAFISKDSMTKPDFKLQWTLKLNQPQAAAPVASPAIATALIERKPLTFVGASNAFYAVDNDTGVLYWQTQFNSPAGLPPCAAGPTSSLTRATNVNTGRSVNVREGWGPPRRAPFIGGVGQPGAGVPMSLMGGGVFGKGASRPGSPAQAASENTIRAQLIRLGRQIRARPVTLLVLLVPAAFLVPPVLPATPVLLTVAPLNFPVPSRAVQSPADVVQAPPVYALTSDGTLHFLGTNSGKEVLRPIPFLPAGAHVSSLTVLDDVAYATTSGGCGGAASGLWALTLAGEANAVASWRPNGADPAGAPAFSTTGTAYIAVGNSLASDGLRAEGASARQTGSSAEARYANTVIAIDPKAMTVKNWFTQPAADFTASPVVFKFKDKDIVAAGTRDGRLFLLDGASLGGTNHTTAIYVSSQVSARGVSDIATWEETSGTRWLLVSVAGPLASGISRRANVKNGAVVALKLTDTDGTLALQFGWVSKDLTSPNLPVVVNGVVFTAGRSPSVLYALDGLTGKELWNSGKSLTSPVAAAALWTSAGQIHLATVDGTLYTFGFPMDRY